MTPVTANVTPVARRRMAATAAAMTLTVVLWAGVGPPAGAAMPTVTISPATGLLDRHEVRVEASGLTPGVQYSLVECAVDACVDPLTYRARIGSLAVPVARYDARRRNPNTAADGTFATTITVRRSNLVGPHTSDTPRPVDCSVEACSLVVVPYGAHPVTPASALVTASLTFASSGTYTWPAAGATFSPAPPWGHRQPITVEADGFAPDTFDELYAFDAALGHGVVRLRQCRAGGTAPADCTFVAPQPYLLPTGYGEVADDGTISIAEEADRFVRLTANGNGWMDCAHTACTIAAYQPGRSASAPQPVSYGPVWSPWPSAGAMVDGLAALMGATLPAADRASITQDVTSGQLDAPTTVFAVARRERAVADITTLYASLLHRRPDQGGLDFWAQRVRTGTSIGRVADSFSNTAEVRFQHQTLSDADAVEWAYEATLGRGSDPGGKAYWVGRLAAGLPRFRMLSMFALTVESRQRTTYARVLTVVTRGLNGTVPTADAWATTAPGQGAASVGRIWAAVDVAPAFRGAP